MQIILFLLNPVLGFLNSLGKMRGVLSYCGFVLFYVIYAYSFRFIETSDAYDIALLFMRRTRDDDFDFEAATTLFRNGVVTDPYLWYVIAFLKQYSSSPRVLYAFFSFIYGSFVYLYLKQFYSARSQQRYGWEFYFYIFVGISILSFISISTTRHYTATAIFVYAMVRFFYYNDKKVLPLILLTPFIHFSFWVSVASFFIAVIIFKLIPNRTALLMWAMVFSFSLSYLDTTQFANDTFETQEGDYVSNRQINSKIRVYSRTTENKEKNRQSYEELVEKQGTYRILNNAFTKTSRKINKVGVFILLCLLYRRRDMYVQNDEQKVLFDYILLLYSLYCVLSMFMSNSGRFLKISDLILLFYLSTLTFKRKQRRNHQLLCLVFGFVKVYAISFLLFNMVRFVKWWFWVYPTPVTLQLVPEALLY